MTPSTVVRVTTENFHETVESAPGLLILAIGASWCVDCRRIQPMFMAYAEKLAGQVTFASANFDENPDLNKRFGVLHIPTLFAMRGGQVLDTLVEPKSIPAFRDFVERVLALKDGD